MNQGFKNCFTYLLRVHIRIQGFLYLLTDCVKMLRYFFTKGADAELGLRRLSVLQGFEYRRSAKN